MIANLRNYEPETIEFVVPDSIREKFPPVLFQGSTNVDELIKLVNEHFNATFPESEVTQRLLDEFEISEIREEYCIKQENEVPKRERELLEAIERAKKIKSDAQDRLASIKTEIKDLAAEVKRSLWAQEDRNRKAMLDLFGIEYPEVERPIDDTEDYGDKFEEDLSDKLPEEEPEDDE